MAAGCIMQPGGLHVGNPCARRYSVGLSGLVWSPKCRKNKQEKF